MAGIQIHAARGAVHRRVRGGRAGVYDPRASAADAAAEVAHGTWEEDPGLVAVVGVRAEFLNERVVAVVFHFAVVEVGVVAAAAPFASVPPGRRGRCGGDGRGV